MPWVNTSAWSGCTNQEPLFCHLLLKRAVMGGINTVQRGPENSDGCTIPCQTTTMRCSIDTFRKPAEHGPARLGESTTQLISHGQPMI